MTISKKAFEKVQSLYGKESVMKLSEFVSDVEFLSTGSLEFNHILGGGFARGRVIELYGPESSGKTTAAIHAIAEEQKAGRNALFVDAEHAFDKEYAERLGVNVEELALCQPDNGEQGLDVAKAMIETGEVQLVVIDSTSALVPKAELEGEMGDASMALQARMLSKALRMISGVASRHNCTVIFISQLREKIGPYGGQAIGVGNAMKFYASQRIGLSKSTPTVVEGESVGHTITMKVTKNKVYPPFKTCDVVLKYGEGYDTRSEIISMAAELGIVKQSGSWYAYGDTKLGQGLGNVSALLADNLELYEELKGKVISAMKK